MRVSGGVKHCVLHSALWSFPKGGVLTGTLTAPQRPRKCPKGGVKRSGGGEGRMAGPVCMRRIPSKNPACI